MKTLLIVVAAVLVVLVAAGAALFYWMGRPLYEPGMVRAGKLGAPLDPPLQDRPGYFHVAPGIELATFSDGHGPAALVVHGGPGFPPRAPWPGLSVLAARFKLVYYHQRGCGDSTRPIDRLPNGGGWKAAPALNAALGIAEQIADIERLRRLLGEDRIVLVGHSFGALLAALYAAEFPEHTRALVLLAPAPLIAFPQKDGGLFEQVRSALPADMQGSYADYLARSFDFRSILRSDEASLAAMNREFAAYYAAALKNRGLPPLEGQVADNGGWMVQAMYLAMGRRHDWSTALAGVRAPVLVVHGGRDLQPEAASRIYAQYFPQARFVTIEPAGHAIFNSPELGAALAEFAAGL